MSDRDQNTVRDDSRAVIRVEGADAEDFLQGLLTGVKQDYPIWENKIHRPDPVLCEADEYLAHFRRWAKQFYSEAPGRE